MSVSLLVMSLPCCNKANIEGGWAQSVTYQIDCQNCKNQGKTVRYYGETGRTGFDRGQDHIKAISQGDSKNACGKDQVDMHQEEPWNFSMKIVKSHK